MGTFRKVAVVVGVVTGVAALTIRHVNRSITIAVEGAWR